MKKAMLICIVGACLLAGCSKNSDGLPSLQGKKCFVIYRRDALGYATDRDNAVKAGTVLSGGTGELAAKGKLKEANGTWVVLDTEHGVQAIPLSSILVVREIK
jgi:hypothetical protein